jgi:hypothetical protein
MSKGKTLPAVSVGDRCWVTGPGAFKGKPVEPGFITAVDQAGVIVVEVESERSSQTVEVNLYLGALVTGRVVGVHGDGKEELPLVESPELWDVLAEFYRAGEIQTTPPGTPDPPADELARVTALLESQRWVLAKTQPWQPHSYVLRGAWTDPAGDTFCWVVHWIRRWGFRARWPAAGGAWYVYLITGGWKYWPTGTRYVVLNRKPVAAGRL